MCSVSIKGSRRDVESNNVRLGRNGLNMWTCLCYSRRDVIVEMSGSRWEIRMILSSV